MTATPPGPTGEAPATRPEPDRPGAGPVEEEYGTGGLRSLSGRVSWAIVAEVANLVGTALLFLVLAEVLGPEGYGSLQAVISIALIAGPLATFGSNWQLIRRTVISNDPSAEAGRALSMAAIGTGGATLVLIVLSLLVPGALDDISRLTIALILIAQMPAYWLVELAATSAVARADLRLAAQMRVGAIVVRLAVLGLFVALGSRSVDTWAWYFAGGNLAAAGVALWLLTRSLGRRPSLSWPPSDEYIAGFPYGVGNTTEGFLAASDRPLLKQYGFDAATGVYAAGYRVVTLGFVPMMALLRAQDRRFFRQGANGATAGHRAATTMSIHALAATAPVAAALWLAAPLFELALGSEWGEADEVIRLLAVLPVIKGFQFAYGNALTAAGNQQARMWLTGAAAIGNLLGNIRFIPTGSWRAAVATTLAAEVALAVAFAATSWYCARSERPAGSAQ
jgi:O-antigen/teichoic acid export membrane protein